MEGMRKEMAAQESKYRISEDARRQLKQVVAEFEQTMAKMLESAKQEKERYGILMDKLGDEKNRTLGELKTLETAFKDLRVRHEELKSVNEHLKKVL